MEDFVQPQKSKPNTFLTVLCILTFVGSGWGALSNLFQWILFSPAKITLQMQQISSVGDVGSGFLGSLLGSTMDTLGVIAEHGSSIYLLSFLVSLLSLAGAFLMFKLNRMGFILYVIAQIGLLFIMPVFASFSVVIVASLLISGLFTLLFIILYALNLKQMK